MYELLSPRVRGLLKPFNLSLYRFQTPQDEELSFLARRLYQQGEIAGTFTNITHLTKVVPTRGDKPVTILSKDDLQKFTSGDIIELARRLNLNDSGHSSSN